MIDIILRRHGNSLIPIDALGIDAINGIAQNEDVRAAITRPRNLKFHRKFFALLQVVFETQTFYPTLEGLLNAIKIALGHCEEILGIDGKIHTAPTSISFAAMDEQSFTEFYERALDLIITKILPNATQKDLEEQVYAILGGPTPNDMR